MTIVVPIFNEEGNLPLLYERLDAASQKIQGKCSFLFVNDGSRDTSLSLIKSFAQNDKRVQYIDFSRNFGHQSAISAGLDLTNSKVVVTIDGDLQDPPELIVELLEKYHEGNEIVYAKRKTRKGEPFFRKWAIKRFYRLLKRLTSIEIPLDTGDYRLMDHKVVEMLRKMREQPKFLRGQIAWTGFRQTFVEYDRDKRFAGESGYNYWKLLRLALDGITAFSDKPLKLASTMGFVVSFASFCYIIWIIVRKLFIPQYQIPGWSSVMVSVLFLGGIQLICLGIIGEYLARLNANSKNRPLYIIRETNINT